MKRREFISKAALSVPMISLFPADLSSMDIFRTKGSIEKRVLGKTGIKLSALGFGGIMLDQSTPEQAAAWVKLAIDNDINYFDVAPSYGNAEEMMGPALAPYRKDVFLACKTGERTKEGARKELERSLKLLRTDHFDLYQLHAVTKLEDVDTIFADGGAMEAFLEARKEGKVKLIGFSAHSVEAAMALMDRFDFDTILFPFNYATWHAGNFGPQVMQRAKEKKMGILALKAMAQRPWKENEDRGGLRTWYRPHTDKDKANKGLRFTLSHPVTAAIPPGDASLFEMALELGKDFRPLEQEEIIDIKQHGLETNPIFRFPMG